MPICGADPWRLQFFEGIPCPDGVRIPTEDADAWAWYPRQKWVYNKLAVAETQGFECGPHGVEPPAFPVFSKPVFNMRGMGAGSRVLRTRREYLANQRPGHIWMPLLTGEHVSTDVAVVAGETRWWRHAIGEPLDRGVGHGPHDRQGRLEREQAYRPPHQNGSSFTLRFFIPFVCLSSGSGR